MYLDTYVCERKEGREDKEGESVEEETEGGGRKFVFTIL